MTTDEIQRQRFDTFARLTTEKRRIFDRVEAMGINPALITGVCRSVPLFYARMAIAVTLRNMGGTVEMIGLMLNRDHSTITYYMNRFRESVMFDPKFKGFYRQFILITTQRNETDT